MRNKVCTRGPKKLMIGRISVKTIFGGPEASIQLFCFIAAGGKPSTWFPPGETRRAGCFTSNFLLIMRVIDRLDI